MMRLLKRILPVLFIAAILLSALSGCSGGTPQMVNELVFPLGGVREVRVSYDEENVTFFKSDTDELVVKEYMTADKKGYYAKVSEGDGSIQISEGGKPWLESGFERYVEVYLPAIFHVELAVTTTSGAIDLSALTLDVADLRIDSTSGSIRCGKIIGGSVVLTTASGSASIQSALCDGGLFSAHTTSGMLELGPVKADDIDIETTSGAVTCQRLEGAVSYVTTSGSLTVESAAGAGSYEASNSGVMDITYVDVTGDLTFFNKNDDITLALPAGLAFTFAAQSRNGAVTTSFQDSLTVEDGQAAGTIGLSPTVNVQMETHDGDIRVTQ